MEKKKKEDLKTAVICLSNISPERYLHSDHFRIRGGQVRPRGGSQGQGKILIPVYRKMT